MPTMKMAGVDGVEPRSTRVAGARLADWLYVGDGGRGGSRTHNYRVQAGRVPASTTRPRWQTAQELHLHRTILEIGTLLLRQRSVKW